MNRFAFAAPLVGFFLLACTTVPSRTPSSLVAPSSAKQLAAYSVPLNLLLPSLGTDVPPEKVAAVQALMRAMLPSLMVATKSFLLFHYAPGSELNLPKAPRANDPSIYGYVASKAEKFWLRQDMGSMAGNGLYLSTDPVATTSYGGSSNAFMLATLEIKAGVRWLNSDNFQFSFSGDEAAALSAAGCSSSGSYEEMMVASPACQDVFKLAVKALSITAIQYSYHSSLDCEPIHSAFVLIDTSHIGQDSVHLLTPTSDLADSKTRSDAQVVYSLGRDSGYFRSWQTALEPATNGGNPPPSDPNALQTLKNATLLSCPKLANHAVALTSVAPEGLDTDSNSVAGDLDANQTSSPSATYHGSPMIRVDHITYQDAPPTDGSTPPQSGRDSTSAVNSVQRFCGGTTRCTYQKSYLSEMYGAKSLTLAWSCLAKPNGKVKSKTAVFDLGAVSSIDFQCDEKSPFSRH